MRKVLAEAGLPDIGADLVGQMAFIMGDKEVFAAAKVIKNFEKEFKKPEMKVGILGNAVLDAEKLKAIADIPSREAVLSPVAGHHPRAGHPASPASSKTNSTRTPDEHALRPKLHPRRSCAPPKPPNKPI